MNGHLVKLHHCRWSIGVIALILGIALAEALSGARAQIIDMGKYPDISGGWARSEVYAWARGEKPPLTPQYQAIYEANIADRATGGQGRSGEDDASSSKPRPWAVVFRAAAPGSCVTRSRP